MPLMTDEGSLKTLLDAGMPKAQALAYLAVLKDFQNGTFDAKKAKKTLLEGGYSENQARVVVNEILSILSRTTRRYA